MYLGMVYLGFAALQVAKVFGLPQATYSSASSCPTCYFGATRATLHSFPYTIVETVTATITYYTSTCADGAVVTVSSSTGPTPSPTGNYAYGVPLFTNVSSLSWTISGVSMQYPTTWVHFWGFLRTNGSATAIDSNQCAAGEDYAVWPSTLPLSTTAASFMFPLTTELATSTLGTLTLFSVPVPTPMISYLEELAASSTCEGMSNIRNCATLDEYMPNLPEYTPPTTSATATYTDPNNKEISGINTPTPAPGVDHDRVTARDPGASTETSSETSTTRRSFSSSSRSSSTSRSSSSSGTNTSEISTSGFSSASSTTSSIFSFPTTWSASTSEGSSSTRFSTTETESSETFSTSSASSNSQGSSNTSQTIVTVTSVSMVTLSPSSGTSSSPTTSSDD